VLYQKTPVHLADYQEDEMTLRGFPSYLQKGAEMPVGLQMLGLQQVAERVPVVYRQPSDAAAAS